MPITTRAPKVIDWPLMRRTELTIELSRRGVADMSDDAAAERILIALHEAAHFIVAVHDGLELFDVAIRGTRGQRLIAGANGAVRYRTTANQRIEARFHLAGAAHELLMAGDGYTYTFVGDALESSVHFEAYYSDKASGQDESLRMASAEQVDVINFLSSHWPLVRTLAAAFLTYTSPRGGLDPGKTHTLYSVVKHELRFAQRTEEAGYYGEVLDADTVTRLQSFPASKVDAFKGKKMNQLLRASKRNLQNAFS